MTRNRQVRFCRRAGEGDFPRLVNGNSASSGQLYLGNATRAEALRGTFDRETGICRALPAPCIQAPELLEAPTAPPTHHGGPGLCRGADRGRPGALRKPDDRRARAGYGGRLCQRRLT